MEYLHKELAQPLIEAVCDICLKKPQDPIEHLAHFLYNYHRQHTQGGTTTPHQATGATDPAVPSSSSHLDAPSEEFSADLSLPSPARSLPDMDAEHMDFLDFDLPVSKESSAASSAEIMMAANEKGAIHVHQDAIKIHEDLFDDEDLS